MGRRLRALRTSERGFTLTELLIVIVILGVLTGIVVFAVGAFSDRGDIAACKADVKTVQTAVEAFRAQSPTGVYPPDMDALVTGEFIRQKPSAAAYTISYNSTTGAVTGKLNDTAGTAC